MVELQLGQTPGAVQRDLETILRPLLRSDVIRSELEPERRQPGVSVAPILSSRDDEEQSDPAGTRDDDERSDPTAAPAQHRRNNEDQASTGSQADQSSWREPPSSERANERADTIERASHPASERAIPTQACGESLRKRGRLWPLVRASEGPGG